MGTRRVVTGIVSAVASDVIMTTYRDCAADATVVLYTVRGGGHAWPGGKPLPRWFFGRTTTSIDATRQIWSFFQAHPKGLPTERLEPTRLRPRGSGAVR